MQFGMLIWMGPINHVLDDRSVWRNLANTVERLCAAALRVFATKSQLNLSNFVECFKAVF